MKKKILSLALALAVCLGLSVPALAAEPADLPFTDIAADSPYRDAIAWAVEQGITTGTSETTFSPSNLCTRGQIVTFLYRYNNL